MVLMVLGNGDSKGAKTSVGYKCIDLSVIVQIGLIPQKKGWD